ncbi:UDP-N-acetylglucosamine 2-epimerase [Nitratireductor aestuarii]|uniref:UDP-N-acetylglucosamine 2-epimerase (non-hydrolyzing) n=1 Tax=Nitratireductor aestuarii TaxID=1735103 RepID=A0A916WBB1_9HYPH|nr:UDP-N-acetylglucosamine 2-epimerase (non-hydrolyzing) [Nitratireductor aestuarii]GGA82391.1 UDP-N-acetylglucosamine 2-epimerase [Nitratireductor aestuarii]
MKKILCVVGTRPEAIKMAPVILALRSQPWADVSVLATGQHRQMLDQVLKFFGIVANHDLDVMQPNQGLNELTARLLVGAGQILEKDRPDVVLVQGDTTTVMAVAMASFYKQIPVGHVEAGLRTGDIFNPFPEEANRVIAGRLAHWHFAPTDRAKANLLKESIAPEKIEVTGNTVIDALLTIADQELEMGVDLPPHERLILVTAHRRENFGQPLREVCRSIRYLAKNNPHVCFLYPVHPNPNVKDVAEKILAGLGNVVLCKPLDYAPFVAAMKKACIIISDSGGVQEEAPALGKPVLVLRRETERPEAVANGTVKLVGTDFETIVAEAQLLLDNPAAYHAMARGVSPYGDGNASLRIVERLARDLL